MRSTSVAIQWSVTTPRYLQDMSELTSTTHCGLCLDGLEHCHGAAIAIDESAYVCSDDTDCVLASELHWFIVHEQNSDAPCDLLYGAS